MESADIGRIASKHVKVTVSQRSLLTPGRERQTVTGTKANDMNNTMNHVNAKDESRTEHEDMETDQLDGTILFVTKFCALKLVLLTLCPVLLHSL